MSPTLIHNPACSKSREALALLQSRGFTPLVIDYLQTPLDLNRLRELQRLLDLPAHALLRTGEPAYAELGLDNPALPEDDLLAAIASHPILLQRPIVVSGQRALIARPPSLLLAFP